ncbi:MAG: hypothetical protein AB7I79_04725 [Rhizobiaceae bacterium]
MAAQDDGATRRGFFRSRLDGAVPLDRLFWLDMALVGTLINLATSFAALVALGLKWPAWAWIAVYLSPLPYNLFLVMAVWRTSASAAPGVAATARAGALAWLIIATLI